MIIVICCWSPSANRFRNTEHTLIIPFICSEVIAAAAASNIAISVVKTATTIATYAVTTATAITVQAVFFS